MVERDLEYTCFFNSLVQEHSPYLKRLLRPLVPQNDIEDVMQDTFLNVWKTNATFDGDATARSWLTRIAMNASHDYHRKRAARCRSASQTVALDNCQQYASEIDHEKELQRLQFRAFVLDSLRGAAGKYAYHFYFLGMTTVEIAAVCNVSDGAVKSSLSGFRTSLRKKNTIGDY